MIETYSAFGKKDLNIDYLLFPLLVGFMKEVLFKNSNNKVRPIETGCTVNAHLFLRSG